MHLHDFSRGHKRVHQFIHFQFHRFYPNHIGKGEAFRGLLCNYKGVLVNVKGTSYLSPESEDPEDLAYSPSSSTRPRPGLDFFPPVVGGRVAVDGVVCRTTYWSHCFHQTKVYDPST